MVRRSNRADHGQRVGEALVVEERAGKKLSIVSAACTKKALHCIGHPVLSSKKLLYVAVFMTRRKSANLSMMRVVDEVPSMEMDEIDDR